MVALGITSIGGHHMGVVATQCHCTSPRHDTSHPGPLRISVKGSRANMEAAHNRATKVGVRRAEEARKKETSAI